MLFSDYERVDISPAEYGESHFQYLDRSARPEFMRARARVENWFDNYPAENQPELASRLKANNIQFMSSFSELFVYELFRKSGYEMVVHPELKGKTSRPDFLISKKPGSPFYVEVVAVEEKTETDKATNNRINDLRNALDNVNSPNFSLLVRLHGLPKKPIGTARIRRKLERRLEALDPDEILARTGKKVKRVDIPEWEFVEEGFRITVLAFPIKTEFRGEENRRPVGTFMPPVQWMDSRKPILDAIRMKANKYGILEHPLVLFVNALYHVDETDVMEALFGKETMLIKEVNDQLQQKPYRILDGAFTSYAGPKNTRISAIVIAQNLYPTSVQASALHLYHNPWAKNPLTDRFLGIPYTREQNGEMEKFPGLSPKEIFGFTGS